MNWFDSWALTLTVLIPAVGAVVLLLLPRAEEDAIKLVALVATLATLAASVAIAFRFKYDHSSRLQFDVNKHWIDVINSHYHVAVDGISLLLLSFLALYFKVDVNGPAAGVPHSFDMVLLTNAAGAGLVHSTQLLIFGGMFLGFAIKVPMFPFHTWLPDAHTEAPAVGSVLLAAILLKLGAYGFIRIALPMLPKAASSWAPYIGGLAVIGIIYGALGCLAQRDMKRLIAFSSVAHMGFVMLAVSTMTSFGINAAIFGMVAHGLITGMLFFLAGSVQHNYGTREMSRLGGLLTQAPKMGWILGFCVMASLGLPGLAGFWGEFPAILSPFTPPPALSQPLLRSHTVVAALGTVLAVAYRLWPLQN